MSNAGRKRKAVKIVHDDVIHAFATRLKELRSGAGLSQRELAVRAGVHLTYISRLERAEAAPGLDLMQKLSKALEAPLSDLLPAEAGSSLSIKQAQARRRLESILRRADAATLGTLNALLLLIDQEVSRHKRRT
ncbi:MAG: helix-turn-helix transcriptional regulator [Planctomycetes bacterium]|nr:helix-turn-helix transcriptional regulator [Planctomycetota bacterium]